MPFVRVGYLESKYTENDLPLISQCIMETLTEDFDIPKEEYFQVFHAHKQNEFYFNVDYLNVLRDDRLLYIQITLGTGKNAEQKKRFYQNLAQKLLNHCKIKKEEVFIILVEAESEDQYSKNELVQTIT